MDLTPLALPVCNLLESAFPGALISDITPTIGGYSNLTIALRINTIPYILKAANTPHKYIDLHHESQVLTLLDTSDLPIAQLQSVLQDTTWLVVLLNRLPGINGIQYLTHPAATDVQSDIHGLFRELGALLSRVHQIEVPTLQYDPFFSLALRAAAARNELATLGLPEHLRAVLVNSLNYLATLNHYTQLIHGDPGAHNILWDNRITGLLDWEWAAIGDPCFDLAWVCWTIRFRRLPATVRATFLNAYTGTIPHPDQIRSLALAQIAMILVRVQYQPAAYAEWRRRLDWTLAQNEI
jgi:aminoglycoside phosphotransferase (APT) family kinase protein